MEQLQASADYPVPYYWYQKYAEAVEDREGLRELVVGEGSTIKTVIERGTGQGESVKRW